MNTAAQMSWSRAALAGLIFGILMCAWVYIDRGAGFDELAMRFAAYFVCFTVGFRFLFNLVTKQVSADD